MIRALVADDHAIVRQGVRRLLEDTGDIRVVGEATSGSDLLTQLRSTATDVVVLDVAMPGARFTEILAGLRREHPSVRVIVLSAHAEREYAVRALKGGASGYVSKDHSAAELTEAIRIAAAGRRYVSPSVGELLADDASLGPGRGPGATLSEREDEVLRLLGRGRTVKEIAAQLELSVKTVSTYRTRLLEKLALRTTAELIRHAVERERPPVA